ncbi:MAG: DUF6775 family putative metallopeptidase [Thermoleophilia bacterium]
MICNVYIYSEPRCAGLAFTEVADYVAELLPSLAVQLRGPLLESKIEGNGNDTGLLDGIAESLAKAKVRDLLQSVPSDQQVLAGEVAYERRRLANPSSVVYGLMYDAYAYSGLCHALTSPAEAGFDQLHIVFTNQLIGTWDPADRRYHARTVLCGSPSIVSISGLVEAPARSPEYYIALRGAEALGLGEESKLELASSFADDCLSYDDQRLIEVVKGYAMQAIAYRLSGEAFCSDPKCRLFNAHWQRELLKAQLGEGPAFCSEHEEFFQRLSKDGVS